MLEYFLHLLKRIIPAKLFKKIQPAYHWSLAKLSAIIYGYPSKKMLVIGVTGTAGKSSTCYFIAQVLESAGFKVGMTTTTLFKIGAREWLNDKKMTMLGRFQTQRFLRDMLRSNCQVAVVETSSQGVEQFRHIGINYDILVFTNLYPEHIEAHGGFENYKRAKGKLFQYLSLTKNKKQLTKLKKGIKKTSIINLDDEHAEYFLGFEAEEKMGYGVASSKYQVASILAENIRKENSGIAADILHSTFHIPLLGQYNVYNVLAAISVATALDINPDIIRAAVAKLKPLPGRLEFISNERNIKIIVDYSFEPKALGKIYETLKDVPHQRIIHIVGSAGGGRDKATQRDKSRRPILGKIAAEQADIVIVTNEDPYDEDPQTIIDQVTVGAEELRIKKQEVRILKILDRRQAIKKALELARANDLVLITGKGAEQAICVENGKKISWDDRQVVREELSMLK